MDPITFEVIRNALVAATDEMVLTLRRSAYSTNIKTRSDFSCAFFDAELRSIAQGFTQPVHLGSMVEQVPRAVRDYGAANLGPAAHVDGASLFTEGAHQPVDVSRRHLGMSVEADEDVTSCCLEPAIESCGGQPVGIRHDDRARRLGQLGCPVRRHSIDDEDLQAALDLLGEDRRDARGDRRSFVAGGHDD